MQRSSFTARRRCGASILLSAFLLFGCSRENHETSVDPSLGASAAALNANPKVGDFAIYATNSVALGATSLVVGGDVGVKNVGTGPFLVPGFALAVGVSGQVNTTRSLLADSVQLSQNALVGDIQTNHLTSSQAQHGSVTPFIALPTFPTIASVTLGNADLSVANNTTVVLPASGKYKKVTIGSSTIVRLTGGIYQMSDLTVGSMSRIEALATAELHIGGRLAVGMSSFVGPSSSSVSARNLRIEVTGINGSTGSLSAIPVAASLGDKGQIRALVLVPNGSLVLGDSLLATGAMFARDVKVTSKSQVNFQDGFPNPTCPASCDDANPCTSDACVAGACTHSALTGTSCSDGNACNGAETCSSTGACVAGTPPALNDSNPCTTDSCDPATGVHHAPVAAGTACSDGNACNGAETCNAAGNCQAGVPLVVDDGNPCTNDACNAATGVSHTPVAAGTACSDGNACNGTETCNTAGACVAGIPPVVDDGNPCTTDGCNPLVGVVHVAVAAGISCSDGNACNGAETCNGGGSCIAGSAPPLDDANPCTTDSCDPVAGVRHILLAAGASCSDGNACNGAETCSAGGACLSGTALAVDDGNPCTADTCDPTSGVHHAPVAVGTSCSDGNACNGNETCGSAGTCVAGTPLVVDDGNPCTVDTCNAATGVQHAALTAGASCSDGNACNGTETCDASGTCRSGTPVACAALDPCHLGGVCDPASGQCSNPLAPEGAACSDGNICNGTETCNAVGACLAGVPPVVDDSNPCTVDSCNPTTGVTHTPAVGAACSDNNACNGDETCDASGACVAGTPPVLDDGDICTVDTCDPHSGVMHTPVPRCDSSPTDGDQPFETRASILGQVVGTQGEAVSDYSLVVFDAPAVGLARTDVTLTKAADGSFRARLTDFPEAEPARTPPHHLVIFIDSPATLRVVRDVYLHPGDAQDLGKIVAPARDPQVTMIDAAGGVASDSQGLVEVVIPAGALPGPTPIRVTPFLERENLPFPLPISTATTYAVELEPDGQSFAAPVTVRLANYRDVPTDLQIPVGVVERQNARWVHLGFANWDGSRFAFQTTHFSLYDANVAQLGDWVFTVNEGSNPNNSATRCGGSSLGLSNGSLRHEFALPGYHRAQNEFHVSLNYDSGLAGSRALGPSTQVGHAGAVTVSSVHVAVSSMTVSAQCVAAGSAVSQGSCGGGSCRLGGKSTGSSPWMSTLGIAGSSSTQSGSIPGNAQDVEVESYFDIPLSDPSHLVGSGYQSSTVQINIPGVFGGGSCVGGGAAFGIKNTTQAPSSASNVPPAPVVSTTRHVFVHHRHNSPFGVGWGVSDVDRLFVDPAADRAILVTGTGSEETFLLRSTPTVVAFVNAPATRVLARDPLTNEKFLAASDGSIVRVADDASTITVLTGMAFDGAPNSMAITYVGGSRHFVVALSSRLIDIDESGGLRTLVERAPIDNETGFTRATVAARNDLVFYTRGDLTGGQVFRLRLTDPTPTAQALSNRLGDISIDPAGPVSGVQFTSPHGLALAADGGLYVADPPRNLVSELLPQANGEVGPDSSVLRVVGDGSGMTLAPLGNHVVGQMFGVNQPMQLSTTPEGALWITTPYGAAFYDPVSTEARWVMFDQAIRQSPFGFSLLAVGPFGFGTTLGTGTNTLWMCDQSGLLVRLDTTLASQFEPTRTLNLGPGAATIEDTEADTIDTFDVAGRRSERRRRSGELLSVISYADAQSDRIDRITDGTGGATTFEYDTKGKIASVTDPTGRTTLVEADDLGDLHRFILPDGEQHVFAYEAHHMSTHTSPRQDVTRYEYADDGTLFSSTRPSGEITTLAPAMTQPNQYDAAGVLIRAGSFIDPHNVAHNLTFNVKGEVETESYTADGTSYDQRIVYEPELFPYEVGGGDTYTQLKNDLLRVAYSTLNGTQLDQYKIFDDLGRLLREEKASNGTNVTSNFGYDAQGRLSAVHFEPANLQQIIDHDPLGHVSRIWDLDSFGQPTGRQTTITPRADGQPATVTSHGITTTFNYDDGGGTALLTGWTDSAGQSVTLGHDLAGNVTSYNDGASHGTFVFDGNNRLTLSADGNGQATTFDYHQQGCGCSERDELATVHTPDLAADKIWTFGYAPEGRLQTVTDPDGFAEAYDYEATGELKQVIDRLGRVTAITHDHLGRAKAIVDALNRTHPRSYPVPGGSAWLGPDVLAGSASANAPTTDIAAALGNGDYQVGTNLYQANGYPAQVEFYRDATFELSNGMQFDNGGRLTTRQDRVGLPVSSTAVLGGTFSGFSQSISYNVDTAAPLPSVISSNSEGSAQLSYNLEYDMTGSTGYTHPGEQSPVDYTFGRDPAGKLTTVDRAFFASTAVPTSTVTYKPNQRQVDRVVNEDGTHDFVYDGRGLVQTQTIADEGVYTYGYDPMGRNSSLTFPDGHVRIQQWDREGRLMSRCYQYSNPANTRCYGATYDAVGNPKTLTDPEGTDSVDYDALNRIRTVTRASPGQPDAVEAYDYNALGALKLNAGVVLDDQRPKLSGGGKADAGVPASYGGQPVTLDPNGRVASLQGTVLTWNNFSQLRTLTTGGVVDTRRVDAFGRLVAVDHAGQTNDDYFYDDVGGANIIGLRRWAGLRDPNFGDQVLQKVDNYLYDGVDHPVRLQHRLTPDATTLQTVYFEVDLTGNVRRLRGASGEDLGGYRYTAFGKAYQADAGTPAAQVDQPMRWKGRWFNALTGLYDVRARHWSPELGVFLSGDEFALLRTDSTLWGWPGQNPLRWRDPSGRIGFALGASANFGVGPLLGVGGEAGAGVFWDISGGSISLYTSTGSGTLLVTGLSAGVGEQDALVWDSESFWNSGSELGVNFPAAGGSLNNTTEGPGTGFGTPNQVNISVGPSIGADIHYMEGITIRRATLNYVEWAKSFFEPWSSQICK